MNSRERIIKTINHKIPDKLPIDFGGMRSTGINVNAYKKLRDYLNISDGEIKLYDVFQQLAEPEMEVLEKLGGDVVQLHRLKPAFDIRIDEWKKIKQNDSYEISVPREYNPKKNDQGDLEIRKKGEVIAKMPKEGLYFENVKFPYSSVTTKEEIDKMPLSSIGDDEVEYLKKESRRLYYETDKAILGEFGGNIFEAGQMNWGYEKFYMYLVQEPDLLHYWFEKITKRYLEDLKKYLEAAGEYINIIQFGDDLGTQVNLQISPKMYKYMIKPYHKMQFQFVKENYPNIKIFMHSCGAIYEVIPELIDAGVDILNPVQISAKGMEPQKIKKEFGKDMIFWGGGADMQGFVNDNENLEEIRKHTKHLIDIFSEDGGYVFNQVHNILANVSPQKIITIYNTALNYENNIYKKKVGITNDQI